MKWYSKIAIVALVVLAMAVIQESFTPKEAEAITTLTKNTGQYFFAGSDTITDPTDVKVVRFPKKSTESASFATSGSNATSSTFTYFSADGACSLVVYSRFAPAGSTLYQLNGASATFQTEVDVIGVPVDSLRVVNNNGAAALRYWITAYR